jgi:UDP-N-acetylglucosamine diphosphorylase / glucose-1-phosphate thymidylyltransferase / UDP-N-acetylgalactosamine diphosphorylase / glucosamine-1-phosphate N-acetyltransferase / galactosamine-1-phosphate N-acetyltransferase
LRNKTLKAVVLAAGRGIRLWPLTENRSKHMLPIAGRPIIEHLISSIRSAGIRSLILVTQYRDELIKEHIGDGKRLGVAVEYVSQTDISGTANAISVTKDHVGSHDFLVVYGDLIVNPHAITRVLETYRRRGSKPTVGLVPVEQNECYGMAKVSGDQLIELIEKPDLTESPSNLANTGIYVLNPTIFDYMQTTSRSGRGEFEITDTISSMAKSETSVTWARIDESDWRDIGRPWEALAANSQILARSHRKIVGTIEKGATVTGRVTIQRGAIVRTGTIIEGPAWIGEDSIVGPLAHIRPGTSIGKEVKIGNFCEIKNSIIMDHTRIEHLSYLGDSIVGEHCNLGAGTIVANLKFNDKNVNMKVKDVLIDTGLRKLGMITGDNVKTGINSSIMPGIRIASKATVPPGAVISRDVMSSSA